MRTSHQLIRHVRQQLRQGLRRRLSHGRYDMVKHKVAEPVERKHTQQTHREILAPHSVALVIVLLRRMHHASAAIALCPEQLTQTERRTVPRLPRRTD